MSSSPGAEQITGPAPQEIASFADVDNVFVLVSHGSWEVPEARYKRTADQHFGGQGAGELSEHFRRPDGLVAKDGSDHAVREIGNYLLDLNYDAASTPPRTGRMFFNMNGPRKAALEARKTTFGEVPIWDVLPSAEVQERLVLEMWDTYHDRIQAGAETVALESDPNVHTLIVDVHDTDTRVLNEQGEWVVQQNLDDAGHTGEDFPLVLVSDREGNAAHTVVRGILGHQLLWSLVRHGVIEKEVAEAQGLRENFIYKGGYTTERYGIDLPNAYLLRGDEDLKTKAQHLHFVQVELNRTMYLTEDRSGIDYEKMARTQKAVAEALAETAKHIRNLELGDWRGVPTFGSAAYAVAMNMPLLAATEHYEKDRVKKARSLQFS